MNATDRHANSTSQNMRMERDNETPATFNDPVDATAKLRIEGCKYIVGTLIPKLYANGKLEYIEPARHPGFDTIVPCNLYQVCLKANPLDDRGRKVNMLHPRLTWFLKMLAEKGIGEKRIFASIEWEFDKHPWLPADLRELLEREEAEYPALKAEMEMLMAKCRDEMMEENTKAKKVRTKKDAIIE